MPLTRAALALGLALAGAPPALAACSVDTDPVAFGEIDVTRTSTGTGTVVVRCDTDTSFAVGISPGGSDPRRMSGPQGSELEYHLFADAGYSIPWGDGQAIGQPRSGRNDGVGATRLTIYGVVPRQPGVLPGAYTDGLQVTLTF